YCRIGERSSHTWFVIPVFQFYLLYVGASLIALIWDQLHTSVATRDRSERPSRSASRRQTQPELGPILWNGRLSARSLFAMVGSPASAKQARCKCRGMARSLARQGNS